MIRSRPVRMAMAVAASLALAGCGAAYFGAALGIVASQKDSKTVDLSFPDAAPVGVVAPSFATVKLSPAQETITRDLGTFNPANLPGAGSVTRTDYRIVGIDFPAGYGQARSNRDTDTTIIEGDRLVIRVNGDRSQELVFTSLDVASTGEDVAARIRDKVRALTPIDPEVPARAYTEFEASYDPVTRSYLFVSGAPGEASAVVFEPTPRQGAGDAAPNDASAATSRRLGLGTSNGGLEVAGAESIQFVVINRGTDVLPAGTVVELFLSRDKVLDRRIDLPFDRVVLDSSVAVGEARRFSRRNGAEPPVELLREDLTPGLYHVLVSVSPAAGERLTSDNLAWSAPVLVALPYDDPAEPPAIAANAVDIVPTRTLSPISLVAGATLPMSVTLTNAGAPTAAPVTVDADLVLSTDDVWDEPGGLVDPTGALASLRINSDDPSRPVTVTFTDSGTPGTPITPAVTVSGQSITVVFDATTHSIQRIADELQLRAPALIDAFVTGSGDADGPGTMAALIAAAGGTTKVTTGDMFVTSRRVTFAPSKELGEQTFVLDGLVRDTSLRTNLLPVKLIPLVRIRPDDGSGDPDNPKNNIRRAANYVRIYDRLRATTDANTSAVLPTVNQDDFATLDAVTQRPVNAGSIRQGQQRVLRFELPSTGLTIEESQLLVVLRTTNFDAHIDLLNSQGVFIASSDDSGLGRDPIIYTSVQATTNTRFFYIVVSTARLDEADLLGGSETFELTISVNQRQPADPALVAATRVPNVLLEVPQRYEPNAQRTVNDVVVPLTLTNGKAEVGFALPQRARVRFATRPLFAVAVSTEITGFVRGLVPFPVEHQAVLASNAEGVVYRPTGATIETSHILAPGVYTFTVQSLGGGDTQPLRLEIETEFIPD